MISIVIPVYNGAKYIEECIDSVLDQSYTDYEIIVINDGSTDDTERILITKYNNKIRYYHKDNGGTASALNEGIKQMKGDWLKWLSADDKFHTKHALKDMMYLISTIPNHHHYIFYTNYVIIDENSKVLEPFDEPDRTHLGTDLRNVELLHNFYGNGSTSLIHNDVIKEVGLFRENLKYGEDLEYWLRCCIKFKHTLYLLQLRTVQYRTHKDSLTSTKNPNESLQFTEKIRTEYYPLLTDGQKKHLKKLHNMIPVRRRILPVGVRAKALGVLRRIR